MAKHRLAFLLLALVIVFVPAMPVAAARDGVGLSCHIISVTADCDKFTITAYVDSSHRLFSVRLDPSGANTLVKCKGSYCSGDYFVLPTGTNASRSFNWATETDLLDCNPTLICSEHTIRVHQLNEPTSEDRSATFGGIFCCDPEAVTLAGWSLSPGKGGVKIEWSTGNEWNNLGFNLYRSRSNQVETAVKLNADLVPSQGLGTMKGGDYEFLDTTARSRVKYYYWLEDVEASGGVGAGSDLHILGGVHSLGIGSWAMPMNLRSVPGGSGVPGLTAKSFTVTYKDMDADLTTVYLVINNAPVFEGGIALKYDVDSGLFSLYDARKGGWQAGIRARQNRNLSCAYGSLRGYGSRVKNMNEGTVLRLVFRIKFWQRFAGQYNIYMMSQDAEGNSSGWEQMGTWDIW